jgi:hypothetical protein
MLATGDPEMEEKMPDNPLRSLLSLATYDATMLILTL